MGYNTDFRGVLKFTKELTAKQIIYLNKLLNEDDNWDWNIDLEFTKEFDGLKWTGTEKTYGMVETLNYIINNMREKWDDFMLEGTLEAQGEEIRDVWNLEIENGVAVKKKVIMTDKIIECPDCGHEFLLD